ncbi:MAG: 50S ribosomal protein L18 [Candidatus Aenigmarchaeota archaeon]|nr:50S ribosomal protein L18 [Candidatus Aenigmarchaeota archaeon]
MKYIMFRRRREKKTDYKQRLALVKSGKTRIAVRRAARNIRVQFIRSDGTCDSVVAEFLSKNLSKYGWNYHNASLPAAYLTGYIAGADARTKGVGEAIVDTGLQTSVKSSSIYAAALGAKDAGVVIDIGKEVLPPKDRVSGKHISAFAAKIKGTPMYQRQFSGYLKKGIDPEKIPEMFEAAKREIALKYNLEMKKEVVING